MLLADVPESWEQRSAVGRKSRGGKDQTQLYLEDDLAWFLAFKNREGHGLQGTAELPLLAAAACLLIRKEKMSVYCGRVVVT